MELKQFDGQSKKELAMVDVAHAILEQTGEVTNYNDLLVQVAEYLELSDNELETEMIQFYTDLNIDGRFISLGSNRWGLRGWYPIDSIDEEITHDNDEEDEKPRRKDRQGFDDVDVEELDDEEEEDGVDYGERVAVDEHGVMVDDEDEEDLGEYKEDLEDLGDEDEEDEEDENIVGLTVVDDDDVLGDDEEEDE
ncbi:DNA-directed RNA polymerase subunit delta [Marinilactibacillus sp. 15R]|uniref:DNA-directed RNA polymerase subunit delta n=1 Tax=Marinilactibacillus sp. 15R TaxID=1911586 RepID=UPI00090B7FBE|nr:DNA-directed RNA polymerase subunit delta [Marinilactibacillus sp. 15R]API90253.1 DNA-directed RNA polymerase subunit delta [Marinilactibacillus sp. 15R]